MMNTAHLNEKQKEVVCSPLNHLAVIAGAGSGKTRVLVHRIAWLIEKEHVSPNQILALTFTNKAATEMRERIGQLSHTSSKAMWIGTFHGIAHRLLRLHWEQAKLPQQFQILDADDQSRLIRKVHANLNLSEDKWQPVQSQWYINSKKDEGLRPEQIFVSNDIDAMNVKIYHAYEEHCERSGLVDFAELLLRSYETLLEHPDLLLHYQQRFKHILIDEFQDTNTIQYDWIKLLAGKTSTLMVVGDDDQSIYSWRGAKVENLFKFNQDFPAKLIRLEQNYRSTKTILKAANSVIAYNNNRYGKNLWTEEPKGEPISEYLALNETDEAKFIVEEIKKWHREGTQLKEIGVFYRSNAQSRIIEEELLGANIPYRIYGGQRFFDRAEIKDVFAYFRLMLNHHDDSAFERAVNMPPRGIGNATLSQLRETAISHQLSLWQASENLLGNGKLRPKAAKALSSFLQLQHCFENKSLSLPLELQAKLVIEESGLYEYYSQDGSSKMESRLENLEELIQAMSQFTPVDSVSDSPLQAFINYVVLENPEKKGEYQEDGVQLMTLHAAKGLEFLVVFLAGVEEGLFPHKMSIDQPGRLEEERRLCYVGMTRARQKLYICNAEQRRIHGSFSIRKKSRFIREIPPEFIQEVRLRTQIFRRPETILTPITVETSTGFRLGERVKHQKFGEGIVLNYEGHGSHARIQVKFQFEGIKWLVLEFAKLEKA